MLKHKGIIGAIIILLVIAFGMAVFVYIFKASDSSSQPLTIPSEEILYPDVQSITATHFYNEGTHTLIGEIALPTPCDLLSWTVSVAESYPEQASIDFSVSNHSDACIEVVTEQEFHITYEASERATIKTRFNGRTLPLDLIQDTSEDNSLEFQPFLTH